MIIPTSFSQGLKQRPKKDQRKMYDPHTHTYTHTHIHTYTHAHIHTYTGDTYTHTHAHIHAYTHARETHTHIHTCTHTYIHMHTYTHTQETHTHIHRRHIRETMRQKLSWLAPPPSPTPPHSYPIPLWRAPLGTRCREEGDGGGGVVRSRGIGLCILKSVCGRFTDTA
jgi:hypothetical protein